MEIEPLQENDVDLMEDHMNYTKYYGEESDENTSEASTDYNNESDDVDLFLEDSDDEAGRKDSDLIGPEDSSDKEETPTTTPTQNQTQNVTSVDLIQKTLKRYNNFLTYYPDINLLYSAWQGGGNSISNQFTKESEHSI